MNDERMLNLLKKLACSVCELRDFLSQTSFVRKLPDLEIYIPLSAI